MTWFNILKTPLYFEGDSLGEERNVSNLPKDSRFDYRLESMEHDPSGFNWRKHSNLPFSFQSNDGNARAKFTVIAPEYAPLVQQENDGTHLWDLNVFEIANDHRGKGKARNYLKEFVKDIRELEENPTFPYANKDAKNNPMRIIATQSWEKEDFWNKMIDEGLIDGQSITRDMSLGFGVKGGGQ